MTAEEIIRRKNRKFSETKYLSREVFTRDCTERKIKAARYFAPILKEKFGDKYPDLDWEEESAGLTVLCSFGPDEINNELNLFPAIAIFILDSIYHSPDGVMKINELQSLLDEDELDYDSVDDSVYDYFVDKCCLEMTDLFYPATLIDNLSEHIAFRNKDYVTYTKSWSGAKYSFICDSYTTSLVKDTKGKESKTRKIFDQIMEMVNPEDKEEAIEEYKKLFFRLIDCYLETRNSVRKTDKKLSNQLEFLELNLKGEFAATMETGKGDFKTKNDLMERIDDVRWKKEKNDLIKVSLEDNYALGLYAVDEFIDRHTRPFGTVPPFDPYKVIAGFFFLMESGDDYAWLLNASMEPLGYASYLLPWSDITVGEDCEYGQIRNDINIHYWDNDEIYSPVIDVEEMGLSGTFPKKLSIAKLLYLYTDAIPPRFNVALPKADILKKILGDELYRKTENSFFLLYLAENRVNRTYSSVWLKESEKLKNLASELSEAKSKLFDSESEKKELEKKKSDPDKALRNEIEILTNKLKSADLNLKKLTTELEKSKREAAALRKEYRNEKEELYSLRELIFSRDGDGEVTDEPVDSTIYPKKTESDIVVVGGLPDWLKAMKTLLPDVKFFGDRVPAKEALKHTDVLWFQTYAGLSHKTFYKTIDDAKNLGVPVRYCPTSGVSKSAEAIVLYDEKIKS